MPSPTTNLGRVARVSHCGSGSAFSLIEAVLAVAIAAGLLIVALLFYRQAADLRTQILLESDRASTMRLTLDLVAGDLRAAQPHAIPGDEFVGDATSIRFIKQTLNLPASQSVSLSGQTGDLVRITLTTLIDTNGSKAMVSGLSRREEPLLSFPPVIAPIIASNSPDTSVAGLPPAITNNPPETLTDLVRFVRFRYWDGAAWEAGWTNSSPPTGVELVLATEPLAEDAAVDAYPPESFRRVVYLPAGVAPRGSSNEITEASPPSEASR
jgi:type II secretory pathway pseudopilin PulG